MEAKEESGAPPATMTTDDAFTHIGFGRFQMKILVLCGMCWLVDGMEVMILSFLLPAVAEEWGLGAFEEALIAVSVFIGVAIGNTVIGNLSDRYGRRMAYISTAVITLVFGLLSALSPNFYILLLTRAIVGIGIGGAPVWYVKRQCFATLCRAVCVCGVVSAFQEVFLIREGCLQFF